MPNSPEPYVHPWGGQVTKMDSLFDDFLEYDFTMGSDVVICPYCRAEVPCSLFFDDEVECPECGKKFKKEEAG